MRAMQYKKNNVMILYILSWIYDVTIGTASSVVQDQIYYIILFHTPALHFLHLISWTGNTIFIKYFKNIDIKYFVNIRTSDKFKYEKDYNKNIKSICITNFKYKIEEY